MMKPDKKLMYLAVAGILIIIIGLAVLAYVFGYPHDSFKREVTIQAEKRGDELLITNNGGLDIRSVTGFNISINNLSENILLDTAPGSVVKIPATDGKDHVVVIAWFDDGSYRVVYDQVVQQSLFAFWFFLFLPGRFSALITMVMKNFSQGWIDPEPFSVNVMIAIDFFSEDPVRGDILIYRVRLWLKN
jgi:hypothetical protein